MKKILILIILSVITANSFALKSYTDTYIDTTITPNDTTYTATYYWNNDYNKLIKVKKCTTIISTNDIFRQCKTIKK